jgi:hypothetical protein
MELMSVNNVSTHKKTNYSSLRNPPLPPRLLAPVIFRTRLTQALVRSLTSTHPRRPPRIPLLVLFAMSPSQQESGGGVGSRYLDQAAMMPPAGIPVKRAADWVNGEDEVNQPPKTQRDNYGKGRGGRGKGQSGRGGRGRPARKPSWLSADEEAGQDQEMKEEEEDEDAGQAGPDGDEEDHPNLGQPRPKSKPKSAKTQ